MKLALFAVFGVAFLVMNPFYFFEDKYDFDARDLRDAVEGTWELELNGSMHTLHIEQASEPKPPTSSFVPSAHACGSRSLVNSAHACIDSTTMPLNIRTLAAHGEGVLSVSGTSFRRGSLVLVIGTIYVRAEISPAGIASDVSDGAKLTRVFP
jgi:hypothetical protein